ncbi:type VI secretion system-associated protein TagF [Entomohabitans teleogrylli]|uniref:type VI secretion system-associated protein TagF n=1 Tax=Entomohabitans teleogrylli TaxID=1384589 RepID=UPI00073D7905|nr:type VI secretion system-associated protein TagF [Entomohabitans teleogrylli]
MTHSLPYSSQDTGWYGKLPATGDFLHRRLPSAVVNHWAQWCHSGLAELRRRLGDDDARVFSAAPVWNFIIPATLNSRYIRMGCMLPARDSVGRRYPLCAMRLFTPQDWPATQLSAAGDWYRQVGYTLLYAVRHGVSAAWLDQALQEIPLATAAGDSDILAIIAPQALPAGVNWQQAADCFDPTRYASFWWSNQCDGYPLYTHVHSGNLTVQLFSQLFDPGGWARSGRGGQYPKMFD